MIEEDTDLIQKYVKQISEAYSMGDEQRDAANEDIRFCSVDGGMWEGWLAETVSDEVKRAKLELDLTTDFVNRYTGEWRLNRANVYFTPDDTETTDDDADLITSIYRADFKDNDGQIAQDVAIDEVAECGVGHFKLLTRFEDDENPENENQNIHWEPIYNSYATVIWDMQAKRSDKQDASWCVVLNPFTKEAFEEKYPDLSPMSAYEPTTRKSLDWIAGDEIYVAERYSVKTVTETLKVYRNLDLNQVKALTDEELKDFDLEGWDFTRERKVKRRRVEKSIFTCKEFIEQDTRIPGQFIPIIPMYGYRKYIDGQERYRGLVRKMKDANRLFNANVSRIAESSTTSADETPIFTKPQIEGLESNWADARKNAYQVINPLQDSEGNDIHQGPVGYMKPPQIDPNTAASAEIVSNFVQRLTGNAPQDTIDPDASGKAINALRVRENLNTQTMTDNIVQSIKHSGNVYLSIANEIYTGFRTKRTQAQDGTTNLQKINQTTFEGGTPVQGDIFGKRFKVDSEVGPQYESQREATVETLERAMALVGPESKYFEPLMAMWLKNITGTGLEEVKEFNRREMLKMGLTEPENEEERQMLQALIQQPDPAAELAQAATQQQQAEAQSLMASAEQKMADAQKKKAETVEILEGIGKDPDGVTRLKYNPQTGMLESANSNRVTGTG